MNLTLSTQRVEQICVALFFGLIALAIIALLFNISILIGIYFLAVGLGGVIIGISFAGIFTIFSMPNGPRYFLSSGFGFVLVSLPFYGTIIYAILKRKKVTQLPYTISTLWAILVATSYYGALHAKFMFTSYSFDQVIKDIPVDLAMGTIYVGVNLITAYIIGVVSEVGLRKYAKIKVKTERRRYFIAPTVSVVCAYLIFLCLYPLYRMIKP